MGGSRAGSSRRRAQLQETIPWSSSPHRNDATAQRRHGRTSRNQPGGAAAPLFHAERREMDIKDFPLPELISLSVASKRFGPSVSTLKGKIRTGELRAVRYTLHGKI